MRLPCQQAGLPQSSMWDFSSIVSGCGCRSSARRRWKSFSLFLSLLLLLFFFFLYSFYSLFPWITNTLVSRRQSSRNETRQSRNASENGVRPFPRCLRITLWFRNGRRPVVFYVKHVRKDNLDYPTETVDPRASIFMTVINHFSCLIKEKNNNK